MHIAGYNVILDDGSAIICGSSEEAIQTLELLESGYSILDLDDAQASILGADVFSAENDAEEFLSILESLLEANSQEEREKILKICAQGTYPSMPEFIIVAIKHVGEHRASMLIRAIKQRLPELFEDVIEYLGIAS